MKTAGLLLVLFFACQCWGGSSPARREAEYYVAVYARQYGVPVEFVRALVEQESGWKRCVISRKGASGLMAAHARYGQKTQCSGPL
jgi:soluble lytic murein transglycosylase-like protein